MLILASASPRRHELLSAAGIPHIVEPASVPEIQLPGEPPEDFVQRLAEEKARAITVPNPDDDIILGADTVVVLDGTVFGKPVNAAEAGRMLRALSGRDHQVLTGICLLRNTPKTGPVSSDPPENPVSPSLPWRLGSQPFALPSTKKVFNGLCRTRVTVFAITDLEIEEYTRSGEPFDKAGAYAIQGLASKFIAGIEGCYHNVVGLPVSLVYRHLKDF